MITTTMGDLVNAEPALQELCAAKLPGKTAYKIAKLVNAVNAETKIFYERRLEIAKSLGEPLPTGEYRIPEDKRGAFQVALLEFMDLEVELQIDPIEVSLSAVEFTAAHLNALQPLVIWLDAD